MTKRHPHFSDADLRYTVSVPEWRRLAKQTVWSGWGSRAPRQSRTDCIQLCSRARSYHNVTRA